MAEVRAGVRTLVAVDPDPAAVMAGLDRLFEQFPTDQLVTLVYALCDRGAGTLSVASAGHPAPLLVRADGEAEFLDEAHGMLLGIVPRVRTVAVIPFAADDTLLLYTDGLVERRDEDLDTGIARLVDTVARCRREGRPDLVEAVIDAMVGEAAEDDIAVLLVQNPA